MRFTSQNGVRKLSINVTDLRVLKRAREIILDIGLVTNVEAATDGLDNLIGTFDARGVHVHISDEEENKETNQM
jgi:hypothetical protein